jgi:hypothetical protein
VHLLFFHNSQVGEAVLDSFPFPLEALFLQTILVVTSRFTHMRLGAKEWDGGGAYRRRGKTSATTSHKRRKVGNGADLNLGSEAAASEEVNKP